MRCAALLFWLAVCSPLTAQPLSPGQTAAASPSTPHQNEAVPQGSSSKRAAQKKASRPAKVSTSPGSGETPAERTARLRRECKGMPNAGACTGMTH